MKILIISDSHGHIANLKVAVEAGKKAGVSSVIHCGDWDNVEAVNAVLDFKIPLYSVLGNADTDPDIENILRGECKKFDENFLKIEIGGRKIGIIHKVLKGDGRFEGLDIVFSGHYHSAEQKVINYRKFIRPGAIINGINFGVFETETNEVEFVKELES